MKVLAFASGAAVAAEYQMHSLATVVQARHSKSGNAHVPRSVLLPSLLRLQRFAATTLFLSLRRFQSVRGAAATRKALPPFTAGNGGGLSCSCASSALAQQRPVGKGNAACFALSRRLGPPQTVLPNPSLEPTHSGMALGPQGARCHHSPRGPSATPARSAQLKR